MNKKISLYKLLIFSLVTILIYTNQIHSTATAQSDDSLTYTLRQKIDQRSADIANLEKEIASFQSQIDALGSRADSLSTTIKSYELTIKKLAADITLTEKKISAKNDEISRLSKGISEHEQSIKDTREVIGNIFLYIYEIGDMSPLPIILGSESISKVNASIEGLGRLQNELKGQIDEFVVAKNNLEKSKRSSEIAKQELVVLNKQLKDKRTVVKSTSDEQTKLLADTKRSEAEYQKILTEKMRLKDELSQEISQYESELRIAIDPSSLPRYGDVLSWPLTKVYITQYFGNTAFASANPQVYNGRGHTGLDFRASIGTPVKSALSGVVIGTGNTDLVRGCYSYGKWIMVRHNNGLSTLYAHLSVIGVSTGDVVTTGEIIGYSGNTGYSTGPHLHFGVYATKGVEIKTFSNSRNCRGAIIPIATFDAYLNPLTYLPR